MILPNVSYCEDNNCVHYNPIVPHDYSQDYLTFDILTDGTILWYKNYSGTTAKTIQYSTDNGSTWTSITSTNRGVTINVTAGDKLLFKGLNDSYAHISDENYYNKFGGTAQFNVYGNILSLMYSDNFMEYDEFPEVEYVGYDLPFAGLFYDSNVVNASKLIFPSTTSKYCYVDMFRGCTSLTAAPVLPATTLAYGCYGNMFYECTSLTTAPALPATILAEDCYYVMFSRCTSLTTAPELPATTLTSNCYNSMFKGCTSLASITCLATDISANYCTYNWLNNVAANGTFTKAASMSSWTTGANGIPSGWNVVDAT